MEEELEEAEYIYNNDSLVKFLCKNKKDMCNINYFIDNKKELIKLEYLDNWNEENKKYYLTLKKRELWLFGYCKQDNIKELFKNFKMDFPKEELILEINNIVDKIINRNKKNFKLYISNKKILEKIAKERKISFDDLIIMFLMSNDSELESIYTDINEKI